MPALFSIFDPTNPNGLVINSDGSININGVASSGAYKINDIADSTSPEYYGFEAADGAWYILKIDTTANTYRYAKGNSSYSTNWTNRADLSYGYYSVTF